MQMLLEFRNLTVFRDETRVLDRFSLDDSGTAERRDSRPERLGQVHADQAGDARAVSGGRARRRDPRARPRSLGPVGAARAPRHRLERSDGRLHPRDHRARARVVRVLRQRRAVAASRGHAGPRGARGGRARDDGGGASGRSRDDAVVIRRGTPAAGGACACARPSALVLDEPTNSLDLRACRDLTASLRRLAQQGTNIILVTHHLPDIIPEIDRVVVLKDGRVLRDGPKADVLTSARALRRLWRRGRRRRARRLLRGLVNACSRARLSRAIAGRTTVRPYCGCHFRSPASPHRSAACPQRPTMPSS